MKGIKRKWYINSPYKYKCDINNLIFVVQILLTRNIVYN